ncbi:MAG: hypothetical protein ACREX0_15355 [Noviherbaspirillum sp.]
MQHAHSSLRRHAAIVLLLTIALLCAQWSGIMHRIDHAPLPHEQHAATSIDHDDDTDARHSCVAFDAAAVADTVHLRPYLAPLLTSAQVLALWSAFASWDAPLVRHFSSRAPPLT